jgi:prepilin-type N-terminal cleavage/methylation domain-containing protein/prepilin-type processing-associated H-X9-DG protein
MKACPEPGGFTLVELLVVLAIISVLALLTVPAVSGAMERSRAATCAGHLRQLGSAFLMFSQDNQGRFPRSSHSAGANREPGWAASVAPYLGAPSDQANAAWINRKFCCPCQTNRSPNAYSYGLNVFFELRPGDSYLGRPSTWRCVHQVPSPGNTILLAEVGRGGGGMTPDHFMCHQWSSASAARNAVAHDRHGSNAHYLFVDGHVEKLPIEAIFTSREKNLWNPSVAWVSRN